MRSSSDRWFGTGHSTAADSAKAGAEAAAGALDGRAASAVFIFCSSTYDLPALVRAVRDEAGAGPVIVGGTSLGEISAAGPTEHAVAVAALGGEGFTVRARVADINALGARAAGAAVAEVMAEVESPHTVLMLLSDGHTAGPHEIVRGAYSVVGATVPLVGGYTGDDRLSTANFQLHDTDVLSGHVVGVAIGSDAPMGIGIAHGWHRIEPPMIVTKSDGHRIHEFDGEPALDVLLRRCEVDGTTAHELFEGGLRLRPLGLSRRSGEDIRCMTGGDDGDRSVFGTAEVPQGALVWLMESDYASMLAGTEVSIDEALAGLGGADPLGLLAFDCGGRKLHFGESGTREEVSTMRSALANVPFAGFYTMGEIARVRGAAGTHQLTLVTLAFA